MPEAYLVLELYKLNVALHVIGSVSIRLALTCEDISPIFLDLARLGVFDEKK